MIVTIPAGNFQSSPLNPPAGVNTDLVRLLGLAAPGPVAHTHIDLATTTTHAPHLLMEVSRWIDIVRVFFFYVFHMEVFISN